MTIHNPMSEATGKARVPVMLKDIQRALDAIRFHALENKPEILPESEALEPMDSLSFDDIILAAKLVAILDRLTSHCFLSYFVEALVREGAGSFVGPSRQID